MTVDVEYDYETEKSDSVPLIVPRLLDYFRKKKITATFFVLGKIAEKYPAIVKDVAKEHEVASHCYDHVALSSLSIPEQENQLRKGKKAIEDLGIECNGVRAPYYMIEKNHFTLVKKVGFRYDSSISTFFPGRYAHMPQSKPFIREMVVEIPVPNWLPFFPPAGLSYYRFFYPLSKAFQLPSMIYLHPCEFMDAPITKELPRIIRNAYARNQGEKAWKIFTDLIERSDCEWKSCREYVKSLPSFRM